MMGAIPRIGVMGGGVGGSCVAALLASTRNAKVVLAEAGDRLGGGSTAKNHGRLHSSATGVRSDPEEVTQRKIMGSRYLRALSGILDSHGPAIYACEGSVDGDQFRLDCLLNGIDVSELNERMLPYSWLRVPVHKSMSVPEFSWNPAALAVNFARMGQGYEAEVRIGCKAQEIRRIDDGGGLGVRCSDGEMLKFDLVVNMASKYSNRIQFEDRPPMIDLEYFRWPVMALPSILLPELNQVIVVIDGNRDALFPCVIPHGNWITFDCKTTPEQVEDPDSYPNENPKKFDKNNYQENLIFEQTRRVFKPIKRITPDEFSKNAKVFYGVHSRRVNENYTSDISKQFTYPDVGNYIVRHGGLATTSLLDAIETVESIEKIFGIKSMSREGRLYKLCKDMKNRGMIFEY